MNKTKEIDTEYIYKTVKETPNDLELGEKIRAYIYEVEEAR
jgi:hypothetical protein